MEIAQTSPATLIRFTCHAPDCGDSWERWFVGTPAEAGPRAIDEIQEDDSWERDGSHYYCPDCAVARVCAAKGHLWQAARRSEGIQIRVDQCDRCYTTRYLAYQP